ncbi:MAG TPA: hypothetical protein VNV61_03275 [Steroidobacteraceae bacterium]|nr:hypothetical protein [Steroidobacteraceae bacterium]
MELTGVVTAGGASVAGFIGIAGAAVLATAGVATLGGAMSAVRTNWGEWRRGAILIGSAMCDRCRVVWIIDRERLLLTCGRLPRSATAWGWILITLDRAWVLS